jgi:hypothetical protein
MDYLLNRDLPQTHANSRRRQRFLSPVDLTDEKQSACRAGLICPPKQRIHDTQANVPAVPEDLAKSCAQRAELSLRGTVAGGKNHSSE